ncbi:hypothetical protein M422DRAFT_253220 [Sphaerobolus stellatus SS14]|uniref:Uncharacterized protein n=1 Tax=Sphaerobolus stellatus (strain SS14) TaxID=990650 RepID=A0A0C9V9G8_SPHS4|nr:hypothetical protein M422DRAFT_253220 [Sphaerobolus stellatus SS14]
MSVIAIVQALIVMIRSSPQWKLKFQRIQEAKINIRKAEVEGQGEVWILEMPLKLILDVITRWSSTCLMLERALKLRHALDTICRSPEYKDTLGKLAISDDIWKKVELIVEILSKARTGQQLLSADCYPTLHKAIPAMEYLQGEWEKLQDTYRFGENDDVVPLIQAGFDKLSIYYLKMEDTDAYGNATVLTSYVKMCYLKKWWKNPSLSGDTPRFPPRIFPYRTTPRVKHPLEVIPHGIRPQHICRLLWPESGRFGWRQWSSGGGYMRM